MIRITVCHVIDNHIIDQAYVKDMQTTKFTLETRYMFCNSGQEKGKRQKQTCEMTAKLENVTQLFLLDVDAAIPN